jgi:hypothetical protein
MLCIDPKAGVQSDSEITAWLGTRRPYGELLRAAARSAAGRRRRARLTGSHRAAALLARWDPAEFGRVVPLAVVREGLRTVAGRE